MIIYTNALGQIVCDFTEIMLFMTAVLGSITFWIIWAIISFMMAVVLLRWNNSKSDIILILSEGKAYTNISQGLTDDATGYDYIAALFCFGLVIILWPIPAIGRLFLFCISKGIKAVPIVKVNITK